MQIARLKIDPTHLQRYTEELRAEIESSLRLEPGVLQLTALADIDDPTQITILEIYASESAYQAHLQAPHFLLYKEATRSMVLDLQLSRVQDVAGKIRQNCSTGNARAFIQSL